MNRGLSSARVAKYAPLMTLPLQDYYYSRISNPFLNFNTQMSEVYSKDFAHSVDKDFSLSAVKRYLGNGTSGERLNRMLYVDTKTSLPDDLLLKADKMTMANSIELRVPMLDHKLLEMAAALPENFKVRRFTTKYILKHALRGRVPAEILNRKKVGFPVPFNAWLRTELKDWVRGLLLDREAVSRGYFNSARIEGLIQENERTGTYSKEILSLASLELWHRAFFERATNPVNSSALGSPVPV